MKEKKKKAWENEGKIESEIKKNEDKRREGKHRQREERTEG